MIRLITIFLLMLVLLLAVTACEQKQPGNSDKTGQVCHIVGGPNDGKQGRYDTEGACCDADESGNEVPGSWGCTSCGGGAQKGKCKDGPKSAGGLFPDLELALDDLPIKVSTGLPTESACQEPKPDNIGCTTLCKPCRFWVCIDGEWVADSVDWSDGICDGPNIDLGDDPSACPRSAEGFCPAECSICF